MPKIRWKRTIITALVGTLFVVMLMKVGTTSPLSNKGYLGVKKEIVLKDLGEPINVEGNQLVYGNKKNYEIFIFDKESKCIAHVQHLEKRYFIDTLKKLNKRKGKPYKVGTDAVYEDGTIIENQDGSNEIVVKEYSEDFFKKIAK